MGDICRLWYLPSNGVIDKIALCGLDLLYESQKLFVYTETVRAGTNMWETCIDFDICHRMVSKIALCDLLFEGQEFEIFISETVRASTKTHRTTFTALDIYQRVIPLRDLHLMTLTYVLRSNILNCNISETLRASANMWNDFKYLAF